MDPNTLPRAIALQYDTGEIVYPAGGQPQMRPYSYTGSGLRCFGKTTDFLDDPRYRRAHARGWTGGGKKTRHIDDNRWIVHIALWAATQAARLPGDFVECGVDTGMMSLAICDWLDFNRLDKDFWLFDTFSGIPDEQMTDIIRATFSLTPRGIIESLDLRRPIYRKTAAFGHFGRSEPTFTWERSDKAEALRKEAGLRTSEIGARR